jgi:hypothetical protein
MVHRLIDHRRDRRILLIVLLVAPLALCTASSRSPLEQPAADRSAPTHQSAPILGFSISTAMYGDDETLEHELDGAANVGATWVRVPFDWSSVEAVRGVYDWRYVDRMVAQATARGLHVLAVPSYTPAWARVPDIRSTHGAPEDVHEFAGFVDAAAARYVPRGIVAWEIWNEPNAIDFWKPAPDPAKYAELLRLSAAAVHRVSRSAIVLTGGLSPAADATDLTRVAEPVFLRALYDAGAMSGVDAIALHPYSFPRRPADPSSAFSRMPIIRDLMVRHGDAAKKIWLTEFGAPTGTGIGAITETQQASDIKSAYEMARSWGWVAGMFLYELRDGGTDISDLDQNFGIIRYDYSAKVAWSDLVAAKMNN